MARSAVVAVSLALAVLAGSRVARAEPIDEGTPAARARRAFQRGMERVGKGDFDEAIAEFERAYAEKPHFAVLFNLGQAYARVGHPVEAVHALEKYLKEGGREVPATRILLVEKLIRAESRRIGFLLVEGIDPRGPAVDVSVDGKSLEPPVSASPVPLAVGIHGLFARRSDETLFAAPVEIRSGESTKVVVHFDAPPPRIAPLPRLELRKWPEDAVVRIDGVPYSGQSLEAGAHGVEVSRPGFASFRTLITVEEGSSHHLAVALQPIPHLPDVPAPPKSPNRVPWIIASAATAVVLGALSGSLYAWNGARYDDWLRDRRSVDAQAAMAPETPELHRQRLSLYSREQSIQTVDTLALSSALLGASALVTAGVLWLTNERSPQTRASP